MKGKLTWKPAGRRAKRWRNAAQTRGRMSSPLSARFGVKAPIGLPASSQVFKRAKGV